MEIQISDYLSQEDIKEICADELRKQIRQHFNNESNAQRLLTNLSYSIVQEEVDAITPNYHEELVAKVAKLINDKDLSFHLFRYNYYDGKPESLGAKIVDQTIQENKQVIKDKVLDTIVNKDYSDQAWCKFESLAEEFTNNIYDFVAAIRAKVKQ